MKIIAPLYKYLEKRDYGIEPIVQKPDLSTLKSVRELLFLPIPDQENIVQQAMENNLLYYKCQSGGFLTGGFFGGTSDTLSYTVGIKGVKGTFQLTKRFGSGDTTLSYRNAGFMKLEVINNPVYILLFAQILTKQGLQRYGSKGGK
ncbi:MAG: hypothetical protein FWC51_04630 [Proteobacteria bacterium]|nr:hypothetical protein [Pseudomonadota bacterium]